VSADNLQFTTDKLWPRIFKFSILQFVNRQLSIVSVLEEQMSNITYEKSGVNINVADAAKEKMKEVVAVGSDRVLNRVGAFASLFDIHFPQMKHPVLVLKTEEPGSKQKLSISRGKVREICFDMINHLTNDILVMGATPLAVQDAIICGKFEPVVVEQLVKGIAAACKENGSILTGGETSEQPMLWKRALTF